MKILPELPDLQFLLREAKAIKSSHRNRDDSICEAIGHFDTSLHGLNDQQIFDTRFSILDAQRVVARQYGFSSWTKMKQFVSRCWAGQNPTDVKLRDALLAKHQEQQSLQEEYRARQVGYREKIKQFRINALDATKLLDSAFDIYGWPGPEVIGSDCVEPLLYISANAVYDADFQRRSVKLMEETLPDGGFYSRWYAQLLDCNLVLSKQPCIYGSAFGSYYNDDGECEPLLSDVVDPENLDRRRAKVGFESMESARKYWVQEAKEHDWKLKTREESLRDLEQLSVDGGYLKS